MSVEEPMNPDWTEKGDGVYTRPLDALERMFASLADSGIPLKREQWAIMSAVKLSFPDEKSDPIPYLKRAWTSMRLFNPCIGATIPPPDPTAPYRVMTVSSKDVETWIEDTFHVNRDVKDSAELFSELTSDRDGLHWIPSSRELLFRISHWKMDGRGTLKFWGNFLSFLTTFLQDGLETEPLTGEGLLTRSLGDLFGTFAEEKMPPKYLKDASDNIVNTIVKGMPSIGPPLKQGADAEDVVPGTTARDCVVLDEATTRIVIETCKARKVSVSATLHAAMIRAIASLPQHPLAKHLSTTVPVDLRRYLPSPFCEDKNATGAFSSGYPLLINNVAGKSFDQLLEEINPVYKLDFTQLATNDEGKPVSLAEISSPLGTAMAELMLAPPPPDLPPITTPSLSSLGFIETFVKRSYDCGNGEKLEVEDFFLGSEMLGKDMWCHLWTFRDRLYIPLQYNVSYHDQTAVRALLQATKYELIIGLKVTG